MAESSEAARPAESDAPLGKRLRDRRQQLGLTLKQVADGAGLSVGFISQIERGLNAPSLSSLAAISGVLRTHVTEFLAQPRPDAPFTLMGERRSFAIEHHALRYERISASFPGSVLNGVIIHKPPGHRSEWISHEGEELFYMLQGEITVEIEGERKILRQGDSMHFASRRKHATWNHTDQTVSILWSGTMDVFGEDANEPNQENNMQGTSAHSDKKGDEE
jgi:transcriptional regulator with XRE-family HTH domain